MVLLHTARRVRQRPLYTTGPDAGRVAKLPARYHVRQLLRDARAHRRGQRTPVGRLRAHLSGTPGGLGHRQRDGNDGTTISFHHIRATSGHRAREIELGRLWRDRREHHGFNQVSRQRIKTRSEHGTGQCIRGCDGWMRHLLLRIPTGLRGGHHVIRDSIPVGHSRHLRSVYGAEDSTGLRQTLRSGGNTDFRPAGQCAVGADL